jgi:O-antigen/teichoic acid export membrane protein
MAGITDRLIKGSMWLSLSRALVNGLTTLSTFVLAWFLVPSDFGLVAIATTILAIVNAVTELSLGQALIRHSAPTPTHFSAVWTLNMTRGIFLGLLMVAASFPIADIYQEPRLVGIMCVMSITLLISGLANPRRIMLQRELVFWQEFVLNVAQKLAAFMATVAVAVIYQSYWALVVGALAYQVTNIVLSYCFLPFRPSITFKHARELFSFSIWLTLGQIVNTLNWRFEYLLIGRFIGTAPLGIYTMGNTLSTLPTREATAPLSQTIYPGFSRVKDDPPRLAAAYQRAQALLTAVALPAGIGMAVVADPLVRTVLGEQWLATIPIIQFLAAIFAIQTLGSLVQPLGMATGHTKLLFIRDTQMLFVRLPIIVASLFLWGLPGVVWARVGTGLLSTLINMLLVERLIGLPVFAQLSANVRAFFAVAAMAASVVGVFHLLGPADDRLIQAIHLLALIAVGGLVYVVTSVALWFVMQRPQGPETEILRAFGKVINKLRGIAAPRPTARQS